MDIWHKIVVSKNVQNGPKTVRCSFHVLSILAALSCLTFVYVSTANQTFKRIPSVTRIPSSGNCSLAFNQGFR